VTNPCLNGIDTSLSIPIGQTNAKGVAMRVPEPVRPMASARVANTLGVKFTVDVDRRIGWAGDIGTHKTSMLQDLERGRPLEIDALVATVSEMDRLVGVPTPTIDVVLALVRLRARVAGLSLLFATTVEYWCERGDSDLSGITA